ncbi:MAG TPA: hypothetical protein VGM94_01700 [Galbitalea sp.]|jgi:hypothetical protein
MSRLTRDKLEEIISKDKPGYHIVEIGDSDVAEPESRDAPAPDAEALQLRYFGAPTGSSAPREAAAADQDKPEDEIVVLAPVDSGADPWQSGPGPKTVVVSGSEGRVIIEQG